MKRTSLKATTWYRLSGGWNWILCMVNQLEKLEAAKAACLVYLSLLSLTGSFLALLGLT